MKVMSPEEIVARGETETRFLRFADLKTLYNERSTRLRQLAAGHEMRDYLLFAAELCESQQATVNVLRALMLPDEALLKACAKDAVPPLATERFALNADWRKVLQSITDRFATTERASRSEPIRDTLARLRAQAPDALDRQAALVLHGITTGIDVAFAPFIGAALQAYYSQLVAEVQTKHGDYAFGRVVDDRVCPCCGGHAVASIAHSESDGSSARYLHCARCQTQWNYVRIKCTHCESTKSIHYQALESEADSELATAQKPAVRAECCDDCNHYLKIVDTAREAYVEPLADDLATITLDVLLAENGFERSGHNPLLVMGT